jgi:hypothetical protein
MSTEYEPLEIAGYPVERLQAGQHMFGQIVIDDGRSSGSSFLGSANSLERFARVGYWPALHIVSLSP